MLKLRTGLAPYAAAQLTWGRRFESKEPSHAYIEAKTQSGQDRYLTQEAGLDLHLVVPSSKFGRVTLY